MSAAGGAEPGSGPDRGACERALSDDLGWALGVIFRAYAKAATATFADVPGGARGYQVLAAAGRDEHGSQLAMAQSLGVDRTVMTYLLDDLEGAGLIERHPDRADRRARRIVLTPAGRERVTDLELRLLTTERHVLAGLATDADRQAFRGMVRQLATHIGSADPAGGCDIAGQAGPAGPLAKRAPYPGLAC